MARGIKGIYFQSFAVKMENAVIIFLKYPEPGKVKTRLAKALGDEKACEIYKLLAENVIKNILTINPGTYDVHIFFTPADRETDIRTWLKPILDNEQGFHSAVLPQPKDPSLSPPCEGGDEGVVKLKTSNVPLLKGGHREAKNFSQKEVFIEQYIQYSPQEGNTLGERMSHAFKQTLQREDCKRYIIIGTDCPEIDATLIENAFDLLKEKNVVIGPCTDGGYYLLGMSRPVPVSFEQGFISDLFVDIDWSTDRVFKQTMEKIQKNNLSCSILKTLVDIDTIEDLYHYSPHPKKPEVKNENYKI